MPTALFISPHLDDVAFSCGGTLLRLADDPRWRVGLCTVFTASVEEPRGFALRCQTDKGITPEIDYMALRRVEDTAFAQMSGADEVWHGPYPEAPHRGYESSEALFAGARSDDTVWQAVQGGLAALDAQYRPDVVFAPQGMGNHADHLQVIRAVLALYPAGHGVCWYRDTPYAIRDPAAQPSAQLESCRTTRHKVFLLPDVMERKIAGCCLYASQIGFQFGGAGGVRAKLTDFHRREADQIDACVEILLADDNVKPFLPS